MQLKSVVESVRREPNHPGHFISRAGRSIDVRSPHLRCGYGERFMLIYVSPHGEGRSEESIPRESLRNWKTLVDRPRVEIESSDAVHRREPAIAVPVMLLESNRPIPDLPREDPRRFSAACNDNALVKENHLWTCG